MKSPTSSAEPVQRTVENDVYGTDKGNTALAKEFFKSFDAAALKAYQFAITVPSLGAYAELDGHTKEWAGKWAAHLANKQPKLMAATFGYVIESLVSNAKSEFYPGAPSGCSVLPQVTVGGTRPDLVLVKSGKMIAWLDLTAEGSSNHIALKDDWSQKIDTYAEVTYASLDLASLALMKENKDNAGALSSEDFLKRVEASKAEYAKNKQFWLEKGAQFAYSALGNQIPESRMVQGLDPSIPRKFIRTKLQQLFQTEIDEKLVPSILVALGVNPGPWGFNLGFSQSLKAGEAWLIDNFPQPVAEPTKEVEMK